jgi:hypothetical protein
MSISSAHSSIGRERLVSRRRRRCGASSIPPPHRNLPYVVLVLIFVVAVSSEATNLTAVAALITAIGTCLGTIGVARPKRRPATS